MIGLLSKYLGGWYGYAAAAIVAAAIAAYLTSLPYRTAIANMQKDKANAQLAAATQALNQFTADAGAIHDAAQSFGGIRDDLALRISTISRDFKNAIKVNPLPANCRPDPVRLRALADAVSATNTAAGPKPIAAMPANP